MMCVILVMGNDDLEFERVLKGRHKSEMDEIHPT